MRIPPRKLGPYFGWIPKVFWIEKPVCLYLIYPLLWLLYPKRIHMKENNSIFEEASDNKKDEKTKEVRVITPEIASAIDGVQVREVRVASNTDLLSLTKNRKNDNPQDMPSNKTDEILSFIGKEASVDGAFGGFAITEDLKGLYL